MLFFWTLLGEVRWGEVRWGVDVAFLWRLTAALAGCNWLGNPPLPGSLTAWAQKIQTTGRNPLCLPPRTLSTPSCLLASRTLTCKDFSFSKSDIWDVLSEEASILLPIETVREIDWVFNLEIWIIYFLMTILSRWNLLSGLIWFPTKPKIVTTDWEFMNVEFLHPG